MSETGPGRGLVAEIVAAYRDLPGAARRKLDEQPRDPQLLVWILVASIMGFVAGLPDAMRDARALERPDAVAGVLSGRLFAAIFLTPLMVYLVGFLSHLVARVFGGQGDFWSARVALVWALVVAIPLVLLGGLVQGVAATSGLPAMMMLAGLVSFVTLLGFLWIWAQFLAVAEGLYSVRRIFAIFLTIISLIAAPYFL